MAKNMENKVNNTSEKTFLETLENIHATSRYERKFHIEKVPLIQILGLVKANPSFFKEVYYQRHVNNIYFDTPSYNHYHENLTGASDRKKFRIRWYGDLFGKAQKPTLEIKLKKGLVGQKISHPLKEINIKPSIPFRNINNIIGESQTIHVLNSRSLIPVIMNRYSRIYFQTIDRKYRVTVDFNLSYYPIRGNNIVMSENVSDMRSVILELKYKTQDDIAAHKITETFPFRMTKVSKYLMGVDKTNEIVV